MNETGDRLTAFIIFTVCALFGFVVGCWMMQDRVVDKLKAEAVSQGYAEWQIVDNNTGRTEWHWVPPHNLGALPGDKSINSSPELTEALKEIK